VGHPQLQGGDQPYKTTRETLPRYQDGVVLTEMPQTIQDTVTVFRCLGILYLWVDSLCIIQKDPQDPDRKLAQMPRTY
jgi:hypothetical protein